MSRIVVGVDGSEVSQQALDWALDEGRQRGSVVEVVHSWTTPYVDPYSMVTLDPDIFRDAADLALKRIVATLPVDPHGPEVIPKLVHGAAAVALLEASEGADLLVVGSHGHGGFVGMLLGSVSQHVLHHANCPVVVVRAVPPPDDRQSPVEALIT